MGVPYRFGDGDVASERLAIVASIFEDASRSFVEREVAESALGRADGAALELAVDLGCGPGHTTRLVAGATGARRTVGLERSADFVTRGNADGIELLEHDVTELPFPTAPADLIYARLLLAHLPEPRDLVDRWATQLRPGGALLLDEMDSIVSDVAVFTRYLEIVTALLADDGVAMYAGPLIADLPATIVEVRPPVQTVARMFGMNLTIWGGSPFVVDTYGTAEIDDIADELAALESGESPTAAAGTITWTMRHAVVKA